MQSGRRGAGTPLCLAGNSSERNKSGKQEDDAERGAGGNRSSIGGQRKPEQHKIEGPMAAQAWTKGGSQPRQGQGQSHRDRRGAGAARARREYGVRERPRGAASNQAPAGATRRHCQDGHRAGAAELVQDVARRGPSTGQQDAGIAGAYGGQEAGNNQAETRANRPAGQIGQQGRAQMERCSKRHQLTAGSQRAERG